MPETSLLGPFIPLIYHYNMLSDEAPLIMNAAWAQVTVIEADAFDDTPPRVVVCEMLHVGMLREKQLGVIDAFKRHYKAAVGGPLPRFIPEAFFQAVQPVQQSFDYLGYHAPVPSFQDPLSAQPRTQVLGEPVLFHSASYADDFSLDCSWSGSLHFEQAGQRARVSFCYQSGDPVKALRPVVTLLD